MRRRVPSPVVAALAALVGIAAIPGVSFSASGKKSQTCLAKAAKCSTLIVHVYAPNPEALSPEQRAEERRRYPHGLPDENPLLRINKLGPGGDVLSTSITKKHELRVAPGRYGVAVIERPPDHTRRRP
jgi:hypothetical protein